MPGPAGMTRGEPPAAEGFGHLGPRAGPQSPTPDSLGPQSPTPDSLGAIARLCSSCLPDPPDEEELSGILYAPDRPSVLQGDPQVGIVATGIDQDRGFVKLLCVDPAHQGKGYGHLLLEAAETVLRKGGASSVTVGADAPYFLYPGVETTQTSMLCLLERHHYKRVDVNYNMAVDLRAIPPDPGGAEPADPGELGEISSWMEQHWSFWKSEVLRALSKRTLMVTRDRHGLSGFCAYNVNRKGTVGPVAVRPELIGKSVGTRVLLGALHRMRRDGYLSAEVLWVGPVVPYARVGAQVSRVFFVYRADLG